MRLGGKDARAAVPLVGVVLVPLVGMVVIPLVGVVIVPLLGMGVVLLVGVVIVPLVGMVVIPLVGVVIVRMAVVLLVGVVVVPVMGGVDGMMSEKGEIVLAPPTSLERTGDGVGTVIVLRREGDPLLVGGVPWSGGKVGVAVSTGNRPVGTELENEGTGTGVVAPPPRGVAIIDDSLLVVYVDIHWFSFLFTKSILDFFNKKCWSCFKIH